MKKYLSKIILIFALLFFVLAIVLFVQAVLGSILFDFNYTETLVMLGAIFAGLVLLALWRIIDLLEAVSQAAGEMRLRLGSLEPRTVTEDFCRRAARLPNLCPQFHLSMQSGCDATLRRMNRRYDTARFPRSVTLLRQSFPRPAITTDLICGFPGETEEEFSQTLAFLRRCDFAQMHIFPYSIRPGTKAAEMEQVPGPVKEERAARASAVAAELHRAYLQGCVGQTYPVLFEQRKDGCAAGHAPNYMPVEVQTQGDYHNTVRHVKITGVVNDILMGEVT